MLPMMRSQCAFMREACGALLKDFPVRARVGSIFRLAIISRDWNALAAGLVTGLRPSGVNAS
ncbi:hypothetical protein [Streptomyces sp. NPDC059455]|uniref:hypothetical protein n=1 Tax=Streptomyces sp. NPDC059455 TaxID=3346837 RepID=UPI0036B4593B